MESSTTSDRPERSLTYVNLFSTGVKLSVTCHPERSEGPAFCRDRRSPRRWLQAAVLALAAVLFMGAGDDSARFKDLGHRMMCTCGCGQVLLECNHVGCQSSEKMRNELLAALDKGDANNDDLILQGFVQEYGPTVVAAPTATGFNRVAWIMPYLVLVLGLVMVTLIVRAWRSRPLVLPAGAVAAVHGAELEHFRDQARKDTEV